MSCNLMHPQVDVRIASSLVNRCGRYFRNDGDVGLLMEIPLNTKDRLDPDALTNLRVAVKDIHESPR